jgi:ABC-type multidrug transport system ATPase subunit
LGKRARATGLTVIASIHQPRAAVWGCFDACAVLASGLLVYIGPTDGLVPWFQGRLGYGPWSVAVHGTEADWVLDLVNTGFDVHEVGGARSRSKPLGPLASNIHVPKPVLACGVQPCCTAH